MDINQTGGDIGTHQDHSASVSEVHTGRVSHNVNVTPDNHD